MISTQNDYHARLERVRLGGSHTKHTIFVGLDDSFIYHGAGPVKKSKVSEFRINVGYPISLVAALLVGMLAYTLGRYVRFKVLTSLPQDLSIDADISLNALIALLTTVVLSRLFKLTTRLHYSLQALGIVAMTISFHNLVYLKPDLFNAAFSPVWVNEVMTETKPQSLFIRGITIQL